MEWLIFKSTLCIAAVIFSSIIVPSSYGLRLLGLFPSNGRSHFIFNERLMRGLAERGHQVDVYSHFPLKKAIPNYTDFNLADPKAHYFQNNMSYEMMREFRTINILPPILTKIGHPGCKVLNSSILRDLINDPPTNPPYDLVILEHFVSYCHLAWGRYLNIPMITLVTMPPMDWTYDAVGNPYNLAIDPNLFSFYSAPMTFFQRLINFYLSVSTKLIFKYYMTEQNAIVEQSFGSNYPSVVDLEKDVSLVLVNYNMIIHGIRAFTPAMIPVGGLHIFDDNESLPQAVKKFLDESKHGFIYFSLGSMVRIETFPISTLRIFYNSFEKIAPVRVLIKIAKSKELPHGLPSNVMTHHWLPQIQILKHKNIKAFITHGGLLSTQESIYYEVPMIGIPLFYDQFFNVESCARKNIAINVDLDKITQESFTNAITDILQNPLYSRSIREVSAVFKDAPASPMDTAIYWVEYVSRHGKNGLRSPIVDMPWWQVSLLDVYGFIALLIFTLLYVIRRMLKSLINIVTSIRNKGLTSKTKKN